MPVLNDQLLQAIRGRKHKLTPFNFGILTGDLYVKTLQDALGLDVCYRYASKGKTSFNDVLEKAANTLVYSNPEMEVEERHTSDLKRIRLPKDVELPKNTLMVFRHVLSTSTKDRDGDVLHSDGADVDPKMLLLWQHVHTLPIGKMLAEYEKSTNKLTLISAIVDMNELCHDAAVMVDNDMGRFSHGFRALDFVETKSEDGKGASSFDIKKWEVLEESLVSVPSNPEAGTEEVLLSLVEGGKLTSPLMKEFGKSLRQHRPVQVPITWREKLGEYERVAICSSVAELKTMADAGLIGGNGENQSRGGGKKAEGQGEGATGGGTPEETDEGGDGTKKEGANEKVTYDCECIECGHREKSEKHCKDLTCSECGGEMRRVERPGPGKGGKEEEGKDYTPPFGKPLPSEHTARLRNPGDFEPDSFRRQNNKFGPGIHAIFGRLKGEDTMTLQSIRFAKDKFTPEQAQKWLKQNKHSAVKFSPAKEEGKSVEGIKLGRVLSKANENKINDAKEDIDEAGKMEITRPCKALLGQASRKLADVLSSLGEAESGGTKEMTVKEATAFLLAKATRRDIMVVERAFQSFKQREATDRLTNQYAELVGK